MPRIPFGFRTEYRGVAPAGEFTNSEGDNIQFGPKLKFEVELPDGDVETVGIRQNHLDAVAAPDLDVAKLKKGELLYMEGVISYGADYVSLRPLKVERASKLATAA